MVEDKWKTTATKRIEESKNMSVSEYVAEYPCLKKPTGYQLLCLDFEILYPESSQKLYDNFGLSKKNIIDLTHKKYSRTSDETLKNLLKELTVESDSKYYMYVFTRFLT